MNGLILIRMLEKRSQKLFSPINELFGGLYVYLFGDFRQLSPVRDLLLYSDTFTYELSMHGIIKPVYNQIKVWILKFNSVQNFI